MSLSLGEIVEIIAKPGFGILAADESTGTIGKRFDQIDVENIEANRQRYRELLFTTPGIEKFLSGVILFEETLGQSTQSGKRFADLLMAMNILPGIKVDKGLVDLALSQGEKITQGLDGLAERVAAYREQGAYFAKWRAVYSITDQLPSRQAIVANAHGLARYAAICQANGLVPIVEPEVLMDGTHTIDRCETVTKMVLQEVFHQLSVQKVALEHMVLKPNMVISGKDCAAQASSQEVGERTLKVLRQTVPAAVPTINFLSGGQSDIEATANLQAMNASSLSKPWSLSYSYGRALQAPALAAWQGEDSHLAAAQAQLAKRCELNSAAACGRYQAVMEEA